MSGDDQLPPGARYEIKFVGAARDLGGLLDWLLHHPCRFRRAHPDRVVHSLYFDDHDLAALAAKFDGTSARAKLRYRWYGHSDLPAPGALEWKRRRNRFTWKVSQAVTQPIEATTWRAFRRGLRAQLEPPARLLLDAAPCTTLLQRYHRSYFLSDDRGVRATIDTRLAAWDQRRRSVPDLTRPTDGPERAAGLAVLEFKFPPASARRAAEILATVPLRVTAHSKYAAALLSC